MKSLVRLSVFALVAAGFVATSVTAQTQHAAAAAKSQHKVVIGIVGTPTPMCPWNDPKGCGID
jgi:hypothetical protein